MTKRFFYTDPLAAAWMAKHFGMKFGIKHDGRIIWDCIGALGGPWGPLTEPADIIDPISAHDLLYVHPDSLHLLEPQVGDLYYNSCNGSYHEVTEKGLPPVMKDGRVNWEFYSAKPDDITLATALGWWNDGDTTDRIIQRSGIAFHHPECEEA